MNREAIQAARSHGKNVTEAKGRQTGAALEQVIKLMQEKARKEELRLRRLEAHRRLLRMQAKRKAARIKRKRLARMQKHSRKMNRV